MAGIPSCFFPQRVADRSARNQPETFIPEPIINAEPYKNPEPRSHHTIGFVHAQRAQYSLIKGYTLNLWGGHIMIYAIFLSQRILGSVGARPVIKGLVRSFFAQIWNLQSGPPREPNTP